MGRILIFSFKILISISGFTLTRFLSGQDSYSITEIMIGNGGFVALADSRLRFYFDNALSDGILG